jgi:hypothetical protein
MLHVAAAARSIGVVQQDCIIYKYLHTNEEHLACCPKWRCALHMPLMPLE